MNNRRVHELVCICRKARSEVAGAVDIDDVYGATNGKYCGPLAVTSPSSFASCPSLLSGPLSAAYHDVMPSVYEYPHYHHNNNNNSTGMPADSIGTEEICCPKCHFSFVSFANSVQNFVQISNSCPSVVQLLVFDKRIVFNLHTK